MPLIPISPFQRVQVTQVTQGLALQRFRPCAAPSSAAKFSGAERLAAPSNSNLDVGTVMSNILNAGFTFDLWFRPDALPSAGQFFKLFTIGASDVQAETSVTLDLNSAGQLRWITVVPPSFLIDTHPTVLVAGTWYHIWAQVLNTLTNQVTLSIRVNDASETTNAATGNVQVQPGTSPLLVGALRQGSGGPFGYNLNGRIDSFGIWNRTLTAGERTTLHNAGAGQNFGCLSGGILTGLVSWYDLDEPSLAPTWVDLVDGNSLSATGTVLSAPGRNL